MTGPEHYKAAERDLTVANDTSLDDPYMGFLLDRAQVHATLALAAATAYPAIKDWCGDEANDSMDWSKVTAS